MRTMQPWLFIARRICKQIVRGISHRFQSTQDKRLCFSQIETLSVLIYCFIAQVTGIDLMLLHGMPINYFVNKEGVKEV